jgi:hypothetical protein
VVEMVIMEEDALEGTVNHQLVVLVILKLHLQVIFLWDLLHTKLLALIFLHQLLGIVVFQEISE